MLFLILFTLIALGGTTESVFELDGDSLQPAVVWTTTEPLGSDAAHVESHARQRVEFFAVQGPPSQYAVAR
jgi:hypothetical protein